MSKQKPVKPSNSKGGKQKATIPADSQLQRRWLYYSMFLIGVYAVAPFIPGAAMWGFNGLRYLPIPLSIGFALIAVWILYSQLSKPQFSNSGEKINYGLWIAIGLGFISFLIFSNFPIATHIFGDEIQISEEILPSSIDPAWFRDVINPNIFAGKEALTMALHRSLAVMFSTPLDQVFRWISALSGALFITIWSSFILRQKLSKRTMLGLLICGWCSGAMLVFFGHVEVYALPTLAALIVLILANRMLGGKGSIITLVMAFIIAVKLHVVNLLLLPALIFLVLDSRKHNEAGSSSFTWKQVALWFITPGLLIGLGAYFFVFHSYNEPYAGSADRQFQQSFLPLSSEPAPFDRYSLFAPSHLLDLVNVFAFVLGPVLLILLGLLILERTRIEWKNRFVIFYSLAAIFPILFFCAMNPTLSIARDWDIFALLFPAILMLLYAIVTKSQALATFVPAFPALAGSLALFSAVLIIVNTNHSLITERLFDLADHTYRTYYTSANYIVSEALRDNPEKANSMLPVLADDIRKERRATDDEQGAGILMWYADSKLNEHNLDEAIKITKEANSWGPHVSAIVRSLANMTAGAGDTAKAIQYLEDLVQRDTSAVNKQRLAEWRARYSVTRYAHSLQ